MREQSNKTQYYQQEKKRRKIETTRLCEYERLFVYTSASLTKQNTENALTEYTHVEQLCSLGRQQIIQNSIRRSRHIFQIP